MAKLAKSIVNKFKSEGSSAPVNPVAITKLSDYFSVIHALYKANPVYWYRGHSDSTYLLTPSALRYSTLTERNTAIGLVDTFKRYAESKLRRIPLDHDQLRWLQVAQHYGIATRLLDWTENAAVGLYFACNGKSQKDGVVYLMNPLDLNSAVVPKNPTIFDGVKDIKVIKPYLKLKGGKLKRGRPTIAINPVWNSDRISQQQGVFTLHGSRNFEIDSSQAPSLVKIPIRKTDKNNLLVELDRVGVNEHSIFPEIEHLSSYLKWKNGL